MRLEGNFTIQDLEFIISTSKESLKLNLTIYKARKFDYANGLAIEFEYPEIEEKQGFLPKEAIDSLKEDSEEIAI